MNILSIAIMIFVILESMNILMLYFNPGSKKGNGMGVFKAYEKSKSDPEIHAFVNYLINWVAGTKLIFIALLIVILIRGDEPIQTISIAALIIAILSFFWRLFPAICKMDREGQISPPGYSKALGIMITAFIAVFAGALLISLYVIA